MRVAPEVPPLERSLVAAATAAASSHNTQPWRFRLRGDHIRILPDFARRCPKVDPDDHHLYASLGCAVENLVVAARAQGLAPEVSIDESPTGHAIDVALRPAEEEASPLAKAIGHRQCTRARYDGQAVPSRALDDLERRGSADGVSVLLLTDPERMEAVAEWVAEGNRVQLSDPDWRDELVSWLRFNRREARRTGDGLWSKAAGNPNVPRFAGKAFMKLAFKPKTQNDKDLPWIRSSAGIAVFVSEADDPRHWIEVGRRYQAFALEATVLGVRNAFINQPVEVPALRTQLASWLGIGSRRPDLLVRFGYGPSMPKSMRRPVEDVIEART